MLLLTVALIVNMVAPAVAFSAAPVKTIPPAPLQTPTGSDAEVGCNNVRTLAMYDTLGRSTLHQSTGPEWIKFTTHAHARYRLEATGGAALQLSLHAGCDASAPAVPLRNGQLEFTALREGDFYLLVKSDGSAGAYDYSVTLAPAAPHRANTVALNEVPEAVLRRATEFLEELRGSELTPEWKEARINPDARIFYRPDIQAAAYYEFTVEKPVEQGYAPAGYIEISSGEHDYPVTSWGATGMSPAQELVELAPLNATLTEFYRLDMQTYAAEYEELSAVGIATLSDNVVTQGTLPDRIEGLAAIPEEPFELVTESVDTEGNKKYEGPTELPLLEESAWDSWAALKAEYEDAFGPLNKSLKERARSAWELDNNLRQYGESLVKGDVRTVFGLAGQSIDTINVAGAGATAQYLQQEELRPNGVLAGLKLTVLNEPVDMATLLPFEVALQYTGGMTETLKYAIVNAAALQSADIFLPIIATGGASDLVDVASAAMPAAVAGWGAWSYWWANGDAGAMTYDQIPAHQRVNTSACWSGCGATAWAMIFGWVDRRAAEGHARWANHWGIYRVNGGLGANAVEPLNQDGGVDNMTWEIRNRMGTYCSGSGGATKFSRMIDAIEYVRPRATAAATMRTRYDPTKLCWFGACNDARNLAKDQIVLRQAPAIVGYDNHYAMAYGYAHRSKTSCFLWWCSTDWSRWFWVNQGWGGSGNDWINSDDVHFAGTYNNP
ncbi:hypothetical protein [Caldilinea sp.]|uniref:hypothetical protein n=1 Tax=Caldilinea sp. TaxID=2293560 RepID=UPI002C9ED3B0|nr:hypothetical protein [Caldilinea sp.]